MKKSYKMQQMVFVEANLLGLVQAKQLAKNAYLCLHSGWVLQNAYIIKRITKKWISCKHKRGKCSEMLGYALNLKA